MDESAIPNHLPRAYQNEILQHAIKRNVIAVMGTGTGKTMIACMLIGYMHCRPYNRKIQKKISAFVVPTVPLVHQQADTVEKLTGLAVKSFCGEMGVEFWDRTKWLDELDIDNTHVIVLTPQIFLNILSHAYVDISLFDLLIIDECHHARKGNPIAVAFREFYHAIEPGQPRPKVLGLTASPIWSPTNPQKSLHELQMTLASTVVAVRANRDELEQHAPRPKEHIVFYRPDLIPRTTELFEALKALPHNWAVGDLLWSKIKTRAQVAMVGLGPLGMDLYLVKQLQEPIKTLVREAKLGFSLSLAVDWNLVKQLYRLLAPINVELDSSVSPEFVSPKLRQLVQVLSTHHHASDEENEGSDFQAIVFVTQRHIAFGLAELLQKLEGVGNWIQVRSLIGHGAIGGIAGGQSLGEQKRLVKDFKDGKFNVLISTSVGEEGLDFPACALVIRYDVNHTMIGYMQSRGRARQKESKYVILMDEYDPEQLEKYRKFVNFEGVMAEEYRTTQRKAPDFDEHETGIDPIDQALRQTYRVPSTGALLTFERAVSLINETCSLLPTSDGIPAPAPIVEVDEISQARYRGRIILPAATALPMDKLTVEAKPRRRKTEAKRAAAFEACRVLHHYGLLNNYLLPHREREGEEAVDIDGYLVGEDLPVEFEVDSEPVWGSIWKSPDRVYLTPISVDGKISTGLISGSPLSMPLKFPMWSGKATEEKKRSAECLPSIPLDYTAEQAHEIFFPYTERAYKEVIAHGKVIENKALLLLAPLQQSGKLDWEVLERVFDPIPDHPGRRDTFVNGPYGRPCGIDRRRPDITLASLAKDVLLGQAEVDTSSLDDSITYRDHLCRKYGRNLPDLLDALDNEVSMIEVLHLSKRRNNLISVNDAIKTTNVYGRTKGPISEILPESWLTTSFFDTSSFDHLQLIPSIIRFVTDAERIHPYAKKLGLADVKPELLQEAVTPPQAVAGFDYQRLETLGDRVLQLCTTVHVYYKFPHKDEGKLHVLRRNSVCNRYLRRRAEEAGLAAMVCSERLTVAKWDWPNTAMDYRTTINRKWLQDSAEALLGVAYEAGGWSKAFTAGQALGLPFGGIDPWTERYPFSVSYDLSETSDVAEILQQKLRYRFKNPLLLLEAITHPSLASQEVPSYNRLEFLGDAVLDMIVVERMYRKYPHADPSELTRRKQAIVSNATLGWLSVVDLGLAVHIQHNAQQAIPRLILEAMDMFQEIDAEALLNEHWEYHPAKFLADVVESIIGAIFVDVGHDYEATKNVVIPLIQKVLVASDTCRIECPIMELMAWAGSKYKCQKIRFEQDTERSKKPISYEYRITIHGKTLSTRQGPQRYSVKCNLSVDAMQILRDDGKMLHFCNCDVEYLEEDGVTRRKRTAKSGCLDSEISASKIPMSNTSDVAMVFDYNNTQPGEVSGMNPVGFASPSDEEILIRIEKIDGGAASVEASTKRITKQQSFYVEAIGDDIVVDDDEDDDTVIMPQYFLPNEMIVISDDED
ncbi:hypothetical protein QFC22_000480 [Naganishia vaughanmartiniae]|uniref:Uncharacterized protein n=1 Tax=Naganishia vaughanmartiniae TaxID=1424756 RepID=A0ACC2XQ78_9TREE|nr:hypothetical protein QFC22_000480 [Naganishia vaughanmartiniae]